MSATEATLRALVLSERVVPGALFTPRATGQPPVRTILESRARDLHMTGAVYADGPRGATLILSTADVTALDPYRHICDHSGYEQIQRATLHIESDLRALMPDYRVTGRDGKVIVRAVR